MDDLEGKINSILSDPESMEQIINIAKMLGGGGGSADEGGGAIPVDETVTESAAPVDSAGTEIPDLGGLGIDPGLLIKMLGAFNGSDNSNSAALLSAIKPYLRQERREKLERATKLAKLAGVAKTALGSLNL